MRTLILNSILRIFHKILRGNACRHCSGHIFAHHLQRIWIGGDGAVTIPVNVPYQPAMANSTLELDFTVTQGKKTYALPRVAVAKGVVATADVCSDPAIRRAKHTTVY